MRSEVSERSLRGRKLKVTDLRTLIFRAEAVYCSLICFSLVRACAVKGVIFAHLVACGGLWACRAHRSAVGGEIIIGMYHTAQK